MKKIFTLTVLALFMSLSAMAEWSLGNLGFSIKEGASVRMSKLTNEGIKITFPEVQENVALDVTISAVLESEYGDEIPFEGVAGTYADGVVIKDIEGLQPNTKYYLKVTEFIAGEGEECTWEEGTEPTLSFYTKSAERKLKWEFKNTAEDVAAIKASIEKEEGLWAASSKGRFATAKAYNYEEVLLDANTPLPQTADLYINCASGQMIVGNPNDTPGNNRLQFNGNRSFIIPDCVKGDEIYFKVTRATKGSTSKQTMIQVINGISESALESTNGVKDSIWANISNTETYKFVMQADGDALVKVGNLVLFTIEIVPGSAEKKEYTYSVVAKDPEGNVLKTFVPETKGVERDVVKGAYSYWMKTADDKLVTYGAKGNEFTYAFTLSSDTVFALNYKDAGEEGVVFLSEAEDIEGATLCTNANAAIRSSNCKSAYFEQDTKICTLQPGSYKIKTIIFDAQKTASYIAKFMVGETPYELMATATNWTEAETELINVTEPTDVTIVAGGNANTGLDIITIFASEDAPEEEPGTGITEISAAKDAKTQKVIKNGKLVIVKGGKVFNAVGAQEK